MRKNKKMVGLIAVATASVIMSTATFAGEWKTSPSGWWWQDDDGSYPVACWRWLDGNGDGWSESYYFNNYGYLMVNTMTPDNYQVNENGAWVVNGQVQTIQTGQATQLADNQAKQEESEYEWEEDTKKSILKTKVIDESGLIPFTDKTLYNGNSTFWSKGYEFRGYQRAYVKIDVSDTETWHSKTLEITLSGTIDMSNNFYVLGDDDEQLGYWNLSDRKVKTISVDVSNQDFVTLKLDNITSNIYIKDADLIGEKRVKVN